MSMSVGSLRALPQADVFGIPTHMDATGYRSGMEDIGFVHAAIASGGDSYHSQHIIEDKALCTDCAPSKSANHVMFPVK